MIQELVGALVGAGAVGLVYLAAAARIIKQYERGVVFRFGQLIGAPRPPGFTMILPVVDRLYKVNLQIVTLPIPAQEGITRDNVTVRVDAVVYFKVMDAANALIKVEDYRFAVSQMAQTSLRSIIGKSDLDDLLSNREKLNQGLELMIDSPAVGWGVQIDRVEIKDVSLPDTMKRSMARQAEADRERRARIINADAELQASKKLAEAAGVMSEQPAALQLRLLQTVVAVAAEKNSTLVLPFPVELLRFLERAAPAEADRGHDGQAARLPGRTPSEGVPEPEEAPGPPDEVVPGPSSPEPSGADEPMPSPETATPCEPGPEPADPASDADPDSDAAPDASPATPSACRSAFLQDHEDQPRSPQP
ncbi:slipin family protein [Streptomyces nodosus]|uniref:Slipin family protein n=1 Tax=Streptomyces nodosus TaxID=40318 RepID=A0A5P2W9J0_9ACTN|nr:slipin family protein [Streptomyces nodosus]MBB4794453.1 regulator of protease activity HflC (stomatin/prohibitin superfamily) [Streptomyces nodosus]QEV41572.1 slipin family protein [Streptomyces nodosus]